MEAATVHLPKKDTGLDSPDRSYSLFSCDYTFVDTGRYFPNPHLSSTNFVRVRIQNHGLPTSLRLCTRYTRQPDTIPYSPTLDFCNFSSLRTASDRNTNRTEVYRLQSCRNSAPRTSGLTRESPRRLLESPQGSPSAVASTTRSKGKKREKKTHSSHAQKPPPRAQKILPV